MFDFLDVAVATSDVIYIINLCFSPLQLGWNYESLRPALQLSRGFQKSQRDSISWKDLRSYVTVWTSRKDKPNCFIFVVSNPALLIFSIFNHLCSFLVYYHLFGVFYLSKLLFSSFSQSISKWRWLRSLSVVLLVVLYSLAKCRRLSQFSETRFRLVTWLDNRSTIVLYLPSFLS